MTAVMLVTRLGIMQSVVDFVSSLVTDTVQIGLQNGVPMPASPCVILTDLGDDLAGTNVTTYDSVANTQNVTPTKNFTIQCDCYGPTAHDTANILAIMWRDDYPNAYLAAGNAAYATDPKNLPFVNSEKQYEMRWSFDMIISYTPSVTVPQDFFDVVAIDLHNVDAEYLNT